MKRYLLSIALVVTALLPRANAQYVTIEDTIFQFNIVDFYLDNYPNCIVWPDTNYPELFLLDTTCSDILAVTELDFGYNHYLDPNFDPFQGIPWIAVGLEYFVNCTSLTGISPFFGKFPPNLKVWRDFEPDLWVPFPDLPVSLDTIEIPFTVWGTGSDTMPIVWPTELQYLQCDAFGYGTLHDLPSTLKYLSLRDNQLFGLPDLPLGLEHLDIGGADPNVFISPPNIPELPPLPTTLEYLDVSDCYFLDTLPSLPNGLKYLDCNGGRIDTLPALPDSLLYLNCGSNGGFGPGNSNNLVVPELPVQLKYFQCDDSHMLDCPDLPEGLLHFDNSYNYQLGFTPALPSSLLYLNCSETGIDTLQNLPSGLEYLSCGTNLLAFLPDLPNGLEFLLCGGNQYLQSIPELPQSIDTLICWSSSSLSCLPFLPFSLEYLNYDNSGISCIPNMPNAAFWDFPLCDGNEGCPFQPIVTGRVYYDTNESCSDDSEIGLQQRVVESNFGTYALSDTAGMYNLWLEPGTYTVDQQIPNPAWEINCSGIPYSVTMDTMFQHIPGIDFPNQSPNACHWLTVDVGLGNHRNCFDNNMVYVEYCNLGAAAASGAYIDVQFEDYVYPYLTDLDTMIDLGNGLYRFPIGDLAMEECGSFWIMDSIPCDFNLWGLTVCVTAEISPVSACLQSGPGWDNSSVSVEGDCDGSDIRFVIRNEGLGNMSNSSNYRIYRNNALDLANTSFQLNASDSLVIAIPGDGATYRLEADQVMDHAGISLPRANVEACGPTPWSLNEIEVVQQNDLDDHIEEACIPITGAYDPNDKRVIPAGYGPQNWVHPNDSILEYTIRFQNTGTDTAFNIDVVDTLDVELLDPLTFVSGVSSHPYTVTMHGEGVVTWHFEDILLPDSFINEPLSNGFVKFKIDARQGLPIGTVINNSAAIYFDYNEAIITNTAFITLYDGQIITDMNNSGAQLEMTAQPNPFNGATLIRWNAALPNPVLELRDATGRLVMRESVFGLQHDLSRDGLPSGLYFVSLNDNGRNLGNLRIVISD